MWLRAVLGAILTAMGLGQLVSWPAMPDILAAYRIGPAVVLPWLAAVLILAELAGGLWLLTRPRSCALTPVWIYTGVAVTWAGLAVQAFARDLPVDNCGCFGRFLTQRLGWFVLVQDALLLIYAGVLLRATRKARARAAAATSAR
ncbi:intracellular growth attenuator family protein [Salinispora arenicola]|uniref:MauE/DoxX family redox-associated membrane protein n=1 Tax=Salinispora arenicola TaxID=168697 RepID=UPI00037014B7|nr:MauE/DoxX family redox-associated membrane protein [Salinispora arenicola]NIL43666.1 intracellular growth attenuator family protein [Salinispora arenicola]NIL57924.1 intracellular growth attenuator family protein [Salinispora arenicola]NIL63955.1 intracellular growth attenuator family protein [Salinispora arenicola]